MNPDLGPKDKTVICCDFTCEEESLKWKSDDKTLSDQCIKGLVAAGFIKEQDVFGYHVKRIRNFYPRYDLDYKGKLKKVLDKFMGIENLLLTGRLGMYNYNNADHCFDMGHFIAEKFKEGLTIKEIFAGLQARTAEYKIVD